MISEPNQSLSNGCEGNWLSSRRASFCLGKSYLRAQKGGHSSGRWVSSPSLGGEWRTATLWSRPSHGLLDSICCNLEGKEKVSDIGKQDSCWLKLNMSASFLMTSSQTQFDVRVKVWGYLLCCLHLLPQWEMGTWGQTSDWFSIVPWVWMRTGRRIMRAV